MTAADPIRTEQYRADAETALRQAREFRDHWRRTGARIDRRIMSGFAMAYRMYRGRAARCSQPEGAR